MRSKGSTEPPGLNRRDLLRLGGVGIADVALLQVEGAAELSAREGSPYLSPVAGFGEYDVPVSLRLATGYANIRWEMLPSEGSDYEPGDPRGRRAYGIMWLVRSGAGDTWGEASRLTGLPEKEFKNGPQDEHPRRGSAPGRGSGKEARSSRRPLQSGVQDRSRRDLLRAGLRRDQGGCLLDDPRPRSGRATVRAGGAFMTGDYWDWHKCIDHVLPYDSIVWAVGDAA